MYARESYVWHWLNALVSVVPVVPVVANYINRLCN
jgi:hypothetical protein